MYTKQITFEDFDNQTVTETLEFNISHDQLSENMHLQAELEDLKRVFSGDPRTLTPEEINKMVQMVKTFMKISYGIRSEDRKRFRQADTEPEVWTHFVQTAAYKAFLKQIFIEEHAAIEFLIGVMPADMRPQLTENAASVSKSISESLAKPDEVPTAPPVLATPAPAPASSTDEISDEDLLKMEPSKMTHEQLQRAFILKTK